jgi:hypothetical protein
MNIFNKPLLQMKTLVTFLLTIAALSASATDSWVRIDDSTDGETRLLVNPETFSMVKDRTDPDSPVYIVAAFRLAENNSFKEFVGLTNYKSCSNQGGKIIFREFKNEKWETIATYLWSVPGGKIYDSVGITLCSILAARTGKELMKDNVINI